jgi:pimeloyl-ACP methyl ester carboxylesterase
MLALGLPLTIAAAAMTTVVVLLVGLFVFSRFIASKVTRHLPPRGHMTDVEGGRIHWVEAGEGRPIVMIHGLSGNHHNFTYALTERLSDTYRTIAIDRPGSGHSTRETLDGARLPEQARMIVEFLDREGIEKPLIVGHSLGGCIALAIALDYPEKISGLALLAPLVDIETTIPPAFSGLGIAHAGLRRLVAETLAVPASIHKGAEVLSAIFAPDAAPADFSTRGGGLLSLRPQAFHTSSTDMHAVAHDLEAQIDRYGELDLPVGVLYGDADPVLNSTIHVGKMRTVRPDSEIEILTGAGHMLPVAYPEVAEGLVRRTALRSFPVT